MLVNGLYVPTSSAATKHERFFLSVTGWQEDAGCLVALEHDDLWGLDEVVHQLHSGHCQGAPSACLTTLCDSA